MLSRIFPTQNSFDSPNEPFVPSLILFGFLTLVYVILYSEPAPFELVNGRKNFEFSASRSKANFIKNAFDIISNRLERVPNKPFRVLADIGEVTILPPEYAHQIRNDERFSFTKAAYKWFYAHLPGTGSFEAGINETHLMKLIARHQLTHQLMKVTKAVSDECVAALRDIYTDEQVLFRPVVLWVLPNCTAARGLVKAAREVIEPVLQKRRTEKIQAAKQDRTVEHNDAISWLEDLAEEKSVRYDPACAQLSLSTAALHSTTDFFTQVTLDIAQDISLKKALRDEIVSVLGSERWTKKSLYNLKLMDSVLKESQRLKPIVIEDVTLDDGVSIPRNCLTLVSAHRHWDENLYKDAHSFDGYRFLEMRKQPGLGNKAQLVSATVDHMGFGFGLHACPGRFFASEEIKIALAHMLMNYDMRLVPGCDISPRQHGFSLLASPTAKLEIRKLSDAQDL
ncbi:hypothetical protein E8E11_000667 [Didymella keratinophila]|nr:hypothetical protein E8E11_000667 [Didymella keratinophila]